MLTHHLCCSFASSARFLYLSPELLLKIERGARSAAAAARVACEAGLARRAHITRRGVGSGAAISGA
jgi:hypothetical protein